MGGDCPERVTVGLATRVAKHAVQIGLRTPLSSDRQQFSRHLPGATRGRWGAGLHPGLPGAPGPFWPGAAHHPGGLSGTERRYRSLQRGAQTSAGPTSVAARQSGFCQPGSL